MPPTAPAKMRSSSNLSDSTLGDTGPDSDSGGSQRLLCAQRASKKRSLELVSMTDDAFPAEMLLDLAGSTSAEVRRMNDDERALVHYKRRLRNRESAKRSRARRQATVNDIQVEVEDLRQVTANLVDRCVAFARLNEQQAQELETLRKEKQLLESMLRSAA